MIESPRPLNSNLSSNQATWGLSHHAYGPEPTIVNTEQYNPNYDQQDADTEMTLNVLEKSADNFVGKYAFGA